MLIDIGGPLHLNINDLLTQYIKDGIDCLDAFFYG